MGFFWLEMAWQEYVHISTENDVSKIMKLNIIFHYKIVNSWFSSSQVSCKM